LLAAPAIASSFSPLYHLEFPHEYFAVEELDSLYGMLKSPTVFMPQHYVDELVTHYMKDVINIQYILADYDIPKIIFESITRHEHSKNAVKLLASIHAKRFRRPDTPVLQVYDPDTNERLSSLRTLLNQQHDLITEDAMAALHVVSSILFDGGRGAWKDWLHVANCYVDNLFARFHGPADALLNCHANEAFVVKTAIWFDVLASVTTQRSPHFLEAIRAMFDPNRSGICDASLTPPQYSMMSPMGCENHVVWALAETSELSVWKREQSRAGSLSIPELVHKASFIEAYLSPAVAYTELPTGTRECSRYLASDIFRASARLYLRSVVSGDYPDVPEIRESVEDTLQCIQRIPPGETGQSTIARSVVRSTVFSFFICGALAEESQRHIILERVEREICESLGNCSSIRTLLTKLWEERPQHPTRRGSNPPVEWRGLLKDSQMLLV
jgi:C6 transcription factor Pro1